MKHLAWMLALPLAACAAPPPQPAAAPPPRFAGVLRPAPAGGFELRMSRSACFGRCPAYSLVIHADGTVDYQGASGVAASGERHGQADAAALARLRARLEDPGMPWGDYLPGTPACGTAATDMPGARIDAYVGGRWRSISHYHGCPAAPPMLKQLEQDIDAAAGAAQWVSGQAIE